MKKNYIRMWDYRIRNTLGNIRVVDFKTSHVRTFFSALSDEGLAHSTIKEFRVSLIVGVALALANGIRILIMYKNAGLALVIGLSLVATIVISKLIGCVLPLIAKKLHMDPAIMASPLITTLVDTCSILIYFNIATQVFQL